MKAKHAGMVDVEIIGLRILKLVSLRLETQTASMQANVAARMTGGKDCSSFEPEGN
jgi:hypothetical protein